MTDAIEHVPLPEPYARTYVDALGSNVLPVATMSESDYRRLLADRERLAIALEHALVPLGAIEIGVTDELHPELKRAVADAVRLGLSSLSHVRGLR